MEESNSRVFASSRRRLRTPHSATARSLVFMPQRKLAKSSSRNVSRKKPSLATARKVDDGNVVKTKSWFERHANVALYVPNVIGYLRIIFAAYALNCAFTSVRTCIFAYLLSFTCDELDGRFARKFNQCSEFGRVLDMVTDRRVVREATRSEAKRVIDRVLDRPKLTPMRSTTTCQYPG